ncbi:MAG: ABC transporter ATP-binding protein [Proteobacteria bacterium]|nr:ABC transporter ATP-binding protein [Pseudomonadota bacterium]
MSADIDPARRIRWLASLFDERDARAGLRRVAFLLASLARAEHRRILPAFAAAIAASLLALIPAALLARLIDRAFTTRATGMIVAIAAALVIVAVTDGVIGFMRRMLAARAAIAIRRRLARAAFAAAIRLPIERGDARDHGLLGRNFDEIERIGHGASDGLLEITLGLGTAIVLGSAMIYVAPILGSAVFVVVALLAAIHVLAARHLRERETEWFAARSAYWLHLVESIAFGLTLRIAPAHRFAEARFAERLARDQETGLAVARITAALEAAGHCAGGLVTATIALLGGLQVVNGTMSLGEFVLFLSIGGALAGPVLGLAKAADDLQAILVAARRMTGIASATHEPIFDDGARSTGAGARLEISALRFAHVASRPVLECVSLTLSPGEKASLIGPSGLGKTTLAGLVVALRAAQAGTIAIDGRSITAIPLDELRRLVTLVAHEIEVFSATVAENIALADIAATRARIEDAARVAGLDADIGALPARYDSLLGAGGIELSAGQRQRLGIARAVLARPSILILDESTSALDPETEAMVLDRLLARMADTTILAITHRESFARRLGRVIDLREVDARAPAGTA